MLLSVIVPVYNEAAVIRLFIGELRNALSRIDCDFEVLFVDDGSRDESLSILRQESADEPRICVVSFGRNFGHQAAITAGLDFARGDVVVVMDADLQDPPELLPTMLEQYRVGYDIVSAQRLSRDGDGCFKRWTATLFYSVMRRMVDERIIPEVGDFRLFSRPALDAIRAFREQHRFLRGLVAWLGLRETVVPFHRHQRAGGETKYPLFKMLRLAWTAISSFSALPLRFATMCGFALCGTSLLVFLWVLHGYFIARNLVPGWASIVALQSLFSGITLICVGLTGEYVARIYEESKHRPLYVVNELLNLEAKIVPRAIVCLRDAIPDSSGQATRTAVRR